jgi:serine/threonine-protein kinase
VKAQPLPSLSGLPLAEALRVEQFCTRFEAAWSAPAARPRLEDFLPGWEGSAAGRAALFCELLQLELAYRCRHGDRPACAEYCSRFPGQQTLVAGVFAEVGLDADLPHPQQASTVTETVTGAARGQETAAGAWPEVPGYEILAMLGRGGMGTVFKASQLSARRTVALKVIRADRLQSLEDDAQRRKWVARFHWEAEAVANLDHPHIVPLYDVGEHAGQPFFSMKLVEGGSLFATVERFGHDPRTAAELTAKVAHAVHHAHQRQILHRDLKPHNILLDQGGQPLVTDFGLACRIELTGVPGTAAEGVLGTPGYMAPEQARAERALTTAVDVYGLGAVLYFLLTGQPPHQGHSLGRVITDVLEKEPPRPRTLNPRVDRDLEAICLKCLRKDPAQRYGSAQAVAEELERWLRGESILARHANPLERLRKWARRRPALTAALGAALLAVVAAGLSAYHAYRRGEELHQERLQRAEEEDRARRAAEDQAQQLRAERLQRAMDDAIAAALSGNLERSEQAIRAAELKGASAGQVRLLRGLVYFQRSDVQPAIDNLEQAARLLPDSVAAHALLAIFYFRAGQWARHDQQMGELARLEAVTAEDFLFKGYQQSFADARTALPLLDEAVRKRDTGVARAIRAEVRARFALDWSDRAAAARAEQDARVARDLLPGNPFALSASLQAHLAAAILYQESNEPGKRQAALQEAGQDVEELDAFYHYPWVGAYCAQYFEQMGEADSASEALRRAADGFTNNPAVFDHAADLYRRGHIAQALDVLQQRTERDDSEGDRLQACLLAELRRHGPAKAFAAIEQWLNDYQDPENIGDAVIVLLVLGKKEQARQVAGKIRVPSWLNARERKTFLEQARSYALGTTFEDELLRAARPLRSCRCSAHFLIGVTRLADGDRAGARDHLARAAATRDYFNNDCTLSRVLLARMEDPAWPPWLPAT